MKTIVIALIMIGTGSLHIAKANNHDTVSVGLQVEVVMVNNPTCPDKFDGSVNINVVGGQPPYSFNWNTFPNQYTQNANGLSSGVYFVDVVDANGNRAYASVKLKDKFSLEKCQWLKDEYLEVSGQVKTIEEASLYTYEIEGQLFCWEDVSALQPGIYNSMIINEDYCSLEKYIIVYHKSEE